jgi:hypothetical protein
VRDDEFHRLFDDFEERVGKLAVVDDGAGGFETANVHVVAQRIFGKEQHGGPGGFAVGQVPDG